MPVLVDHQIESLTEGSSPSIRLGKSFIQSCSADLPIGTVIRQVAGEPARNDQFSVESFIKRHTRNIYSFNDRKAVVLSPGQTYLVDLDVDFALPRGVSVYSNPRSNSARNGLHAKLICDGGQDYDILPAGYQGKAYAIVTPRVFPVELNKGDALVQAWFIDGQRERLPSRELEHWHRQLGLVVGEKSPEFVEGGIMLHLNLRAVPSNLIANRHADPIPFGKKNVLDPVEYFQERRLSNGGDLQLGPGEFALTCTTEMIRVPPMFCAELEPFNARQGDYRTHEAGFIGPGFGYGRTGDIQGSAIICEVTNFNVASIMLSDTQRIGKLVFEKLAGEPSRVYGENGRSDFQGQREIRPSSNFMPWQTRII